MDRFQMHHTIHFTTVLSLSPLLNTATANFTGVELDAFARVGDVSLEAKYK